MKDHIRCPGVAMASEPHPSAAESEGNKESWESLQFMGLNSSPFSAVKAQALNGADDTSVPLARSSWTPGLL